MKPPEHPARGQDSARPIAVRNRRLALNFWLIVAGVLLLHVGLIVATSPSLFRPADPSLDDQLAQGDALLREGRYAEAIAIYKQVLEQQPKPPPVFARAAEQLRLADRLERQKRSEETRPQPATAAARGPSGPDPGGAALRANAPATRRADPDIPPEFRDSP